jgi:hypothetical protein
MKEESSVLGKNRIQKNQACRWKSQLIPSVQKNQGFIKKTFEAEGRIQACQIENGFWSIQARL